MKTSPFTQISLQPQTPRKIICERRLDIIKLAVVACLIYFLLEPFTEPHISKFIAIIGFYPIFILWLIYSLTLSILCLPVVRYGGFSLRGFLKYPPFWLAAVIDLLIIWLFQHYTSKSSSWGTSLESLLWTFSIALTGAFFISWIL